MATIPIAEREFALAPFHSDRLMNLAERDEKFGMEADSNSTYKRFMERVSYVHKNIAAVWIF
jgi:hypothetical protein